jgi:hypothetical protein
MSTTTTHDWARNAAGCACIRASIAQEACEQVWRGESIPYLSPRHPMEGGDPEQYQLWVDEVASALSLQRLAGMR